ncbi:MAG TPA: PEP-CTERM sorting domain-containing protein [Bryobacteraceae bacterium]
MKRNQVLCGLGTLMLAVAPAAHATLLSPALANLEPGGVSIPVGNDTTDHNGNNPIGTLVASTGVEAISNTGAPNAACPTGCTLTGSFISEVYQEAGGTLDFYYQVSIKAGSTSSLEDLDVSDFLASNVGSLNGVNTGDTGNVALLGTSGVPGACGFGANPACAPVTLTGANKGTSVPFATFYLDDGTGTLDFDFDGTGVKGGKTSLVMAVSTNDTLFELGAASLDGSGGTSEDLFAFEPLSSVPEPVSIVLLGTTLALAALFIRRRHVGKVSKAETES